MKIHVHLCQSVGNVAQLSYLCGQEGILPYTPNLLRSYKL